MKAWTYRRYGGPEVLEWTEGPDPAPGPGEIAIRVVAAAANPLDWKLPAGEMKLMTRWRMPRGVGFDVAGVVESTGPGVEGPRPGDAVFGLVNPITSRAGTFAERVCLQASLAVPKPARLTWAEAAALPGSGLTALQALRQAGLAAGQRVLVVGAAGGVGSSAVQLARHAGARVTAVASAAGVPHLAALGAERAIDRATTDWKSLAERFDIVFDSSGTSTIEEARGLLEPEGVLAHVLPNARLWLGAQWLRLTSRQRCVLVMEKVDAADLAELGRLAEAGGLRPFVSREAPVADVPRVLGEMRAGHNLGKTVFRVSPDPATAAP